MGAICAGCFRFHVTTDDNQILYRSPEVRCSRNGVILDPYEKKLLGITAMQKLLGKSRFDELLTAYIEKPQGKPTLVPDSDKRPAMNTAKNDFMEENDNE